MSNYTINKGYFGWPTDIAKYLHVVGRNNFTSLTFNFANLFFKQLTLLIEVFSHFTF
ncbi:hypothetical protein HanRHA438_Chr14g0669121 [Helianthus annuus]|nr:hypothetical protein HanRHA438_Chr14g0669121 [Helianthus annuus]